MAGGYMGKYCIIDLGSQAVETIEPGDDFYRKYLSGYGLGAAVIMERQKPGLDPFSPESYLGFCSGLLTGTRAFFSGRLLVVGKSPLTGGWGDANAGGFLSRELKRTGYDAIFFTGKAAAPTWVDITEQGFTFHDAANIWGKNIIETERLIKDMIEDKWTQIASIGQGGENLSRISGIATDRGRIAARSGLGAVMGSKNLKAVAFHGQAKIPVARPDALKSINRKFLEDYKKSKLSDRLTVRYMHTVSKIIARTGISVPSQPSTLRELYRQYGTPGLTVYSAMTGDMPIKNWSGVGITDYSYESAAKNSDKNVTRYQKRKYACQSCPLGCGGIIEIEKGRFKGTHGHKPEYETLGAFGGLLLNDDLDTIIELNEMCNRAGIDTISAGGVMAFTIECFENGLIDTTDTDGLILEWGKPDALVQLLEKIIDRNGIGNTLADGVKIAAEKIGKDSAKFAMHAGGQELPMHDSRFDPGYAIAYECEPTPGRHTISCYQYAGLFGVEHSFPAANLMIKKTKGKMARNVRLYAAGSFYMQLLNCAGMCLFGAMTSRLPLVEYFNAVTGWDLSADAYFKSGERILSLRKAFNARENIKPGDHALSGRAVGETPLASGPLKGVTIDIQNLREEFFKVVGWDPATGGPTPAKMEELGIE
ncbi:MAG: aldehyde ferredoxin oxidoreductase family protein [Desulfobacterales bacterium]|nr:aldehyde ferredoxin oxidoreductase family protein [Desulfobacterales bacterium]MDX2513470.1 aldehyde ferredoxin oxidoreductase family protein [Desulfobacterales bacterium]